MSFLLYAVLGGTALFVIIGTLLYANYKRKYRYTAWIIAQVGENYTIIEDKMRVYKTEKNNYALKFWSQRHLTRSSPNYSFWTFFVLGKQADALIGAEEDKYTKKQLDNIISRGCIFKMTSEGDITPAKIQDDLSIKVLSQDDRAFAAEAAEQTNALLSDKMTKMVQQVLAFMFVVILIGATVFVIIYLNTTLSDTISNICGGAARQATPFNVSSIPGVGA